MLIQLLGAPKRRTVPILLPKEYEPRVCDLYKNNTDCFGPTMLLNMFEPLTVFLHKLLSIIARHGQRRLMLHQPVICEKKKKWKRRRAAAPMESLDLWDRTAIADSCWHRRFHRKPRHHHQTPAVSEMGVWGKKANANDHTTGEVKVNKTKEDKTICSCVLFVTL